MKLVTIFILAVLAAFSAAPDGIHLAWVEDPTRTLTVVWHTAEEGVPSIVKYREPASDLWLKVQGAVRPTGATGVVHEATIRGLQPATKYEYRVTGAGDAYSPVHSVRTAPLPGPEPYEIVFAADTGMIGREDGLITGTEQLIAEIGKLDPLMVIWGGDAAYYNTDKRFGTLDDTIIAWVNQMAPVAVKAPIMPTYGNHEIFLREGYLFWAEHFPTPAGFDNRRYYSFDVGDAHFVSIVAANSERGPLASSVLRWIDRDMAAARQAGKKWIIPYMHVSPFSDGSNHPSNMDYRRQLAPIMEKHDVKIVLATHDQSYERTYPLRGVPANLDPTSTSMHCYTKDDGVTYFKVSPGGKLSNINKSFATFKTNPKPPFTAFRDNTKHHFAKLTISPGFLKVEIYGVDGDGTLPVIQDHLVYRDACPKE
jgi:purple acid phosphatase-like protein/calcineurin-like phosphoesterase family protein